MVVVQGTAILRRALATRTDPSISAQIHAAGWYESEAEDLFSLACGIFTRSQNENFTAN